MEKMISRDVRSPGQFLVAQRRYLHLMYYDNHRTDIEGQLAAGQISTAALLGRLALEQGILVFLLGKGTCGLNATNVWCVLKQAESENTAIFEKAVELAVRNPITLEETRTYIDDCIAFVETRLGVSRSGYHSEASFEQYVQQVKGMGRLIALVQPDQRGQGDAGD